jgi:RimJ/RimL family protein N-acetyltransferase
MRDWLHDIPDVITTERLLIRPHKAGDGAAYFQAIVESLDDLRQWPAAMGWALAEQTPEGTEAFCRACRIAFDERQDFPLLITLRDDETVVGSSGLHRPDWSVPKLEIGWWGRSTYSGRGLITEAVGAIIQFAFEHLRARRVFALPDDENVASWRICERVGMSYEGLLKHERAEPDGTLRNTRLYASTR